MKERRGRDRSKWDDAVLDRAFADLRKQVVHLDGQVARLRRKIVMMSGSNVKLKVYR